MATPRDLLNKLNDEDSEEIKSAIKKTRNFLILTSLQLKGRRDGVITPEEIVKILTEPVEGLKKLRESDVSVNSKAIKVLNVCAAAIEGQLAVLLKKNNEIGNYYKHNSNPLKEELAKPRPK